ncbi:cupredoxin domain-containing protein [Acidihalobacter aeolianus]|uniref:Blue (type 1) copper domain-containing protein n=2 Tax=Acidihalobacter TaxID=1765964 RepID=B2ZFM9_9GAMM|nr:hypothetical protein [Acidihalobacter aeolianus]ACD03838.1 hypothetical protein [Acidihalobacter aeolianus]
MAQSSTPGVAPKGGGQVLIALIIFVILFVIGWWWTQTTQPTAGGTMTSDGYHHYTIDEHDFYYEPGHLTWHVGEKVELTLFNANHAQPGQNHQWNMGRNLATSSTGFAQHRQPDGWDQNFFAGVTIDTKSGSEKVQKDFSVSLTPGQHFTFKFTVPNKPGKWTYACFLQNGQHYLSGMHGTVDVVPANAG